MIQISKKVREKLKELENESLRAIVFRANFERVNVSCKSEEKLEKIDQFF